MPSIEEMPPEEVHDERPYPYHKKPTTITPNPQYKKAERKFLTCKYNDVGFCNKINHDVDNYFGIRDHCGQCKFWVSRAIKRKSIWEKIFP
jgi:hypothetical protein